MQQSSNKPKVFFVLGGPGSGKGTQCELIMKKYHYAKFQHISTGQLLRNAATKDTPENREIIKMMKEGKMVPSRPLVKLIKNHIEENGNQYTYMLDGFPRNKDNLEAWKEVIGDDFNVMFLIYFQVAEEELRRRLTNRAKTSGRADDNPQTIEKRLKTFAGETKPMLEYYRKNGGEVVSIESNTYIEKIEWHVCVLLKKNRLI